jgi:predicted 3-demethylubiquinone-9 3-methyltransferase (glyoxalase superfamily)
MIVDKKERLTHNVIIHGKSNVQIERMCTWCHDKFGTRFSIVDRPQKFGRDGTWQCLWRKEEDMWKSPVYEFSFDYEQDALLFTLRWS